ncbi:MAG: polysaccharide biosynthesis tyrosine autokinase [Lachnospiraceae bacterium]|nr:polysaccharide biosynthesis tyrosine autokinase [Lachnospiraceae bacterium]
MSEFHEKNTKQESFVDVVDLTVLIVDIWKGIKKYWWLCVICMAVGAAGFFVQAVTSYVPIYRAESTLTVTVSQGSEYDESNSTYGFYYNIATADQMTKTFPYILQSEILTDMIKEDLGVSYINGSISASGVESSNLFTLSVTGRDPQAAKDILESVIRNYPAVSKYVIGNTKINIIEPVILPEKPINEPNYTNSVTMGIMLGAAVGFIVIVFYALARRTIRKADDLKERLNIVSLGEIPYVHFKKRKGTFDQSISIQNEKTGYAFKEAIRTLGVRVEKDLDENQDKVLLVSSTLPQEGKSVIALNLAYRLAKKGKSIILIDANLRKPEIRELAGVATDKGEMTDYLLNGEQLRLFEVKKMNKKLYVVGNTQPIKNPTKILSSERMKKMVKKLSEHCDYIIIDTPPVSVSADAGIVAEISDAALYVIQQDYAKMWDVLDGISVLGISDTRMCGYVMNKVESGLEGYGYAYGYGIYGYGRYGKYAYKSYGKYGKYGKHVYENSEEDE